MKLSPVATLALALIGALAGCGGSPAGRGSPAPRANASVPGPPPGHIYWATGQNSIGRAAIDGSGVALNFIPYPKGYPGMALGVGNGHIYWTARGAWPTPSAVVRANLDGTGIDTHFIAMTPPAGPYFGSDVAVLGSHIYWADDTGLEVANLDGTGVTDVRGASGFGEGFAIEGNSAYSADDAEQTIEEATFTSSAVDRQTQHVLVGGDYVDNPQCLVADGSHIYWTNQRGGQNGGGSVVESKLDGTAPKVVFDLPAFNGGYLPDCLAIDSGHIYWTSPDGIGRANLDGSGVDPTFMKVSADGPIAVGP